MTTIDEDKLFEDTLLDYDAWGKKVYVRIDNDQNGGYIETRIGDDKNKVYLKTKEELETESIETIEEARGPHGSAFSERGFDRDNDPHYFFNNLKKKLKKKLQKKKRRPDIDPYEEEDWDE